MNDIPADPGLARERASKEYEDPHYHDEDEALPPEDGPAHRPLRRGKPARKLPPRRRYEYED